MHLPARPIELDPAWVRRQFPALAGDFVFMDNAGGSQILATVVERIRDYLLTTNVQLGATYEVSRASTARVAEGVRAMAEYVSAEGPEEILIGSSTSMLLRVLAICLGRTWHPGDEVIVTDCDHEANIGPWADLAESGIVVRTWPVDPDSCSLRLDDLAPLMNERTRLVAFTHASNVVGTIHPVREIARFVRERGALTCVDGVAHAPHRRVDVGDLGVDFYAFSLYKVYGPHCALLYGRRSHLERLPRFNHWFLDHEVPYRLQPGGVNYELTYGLTGLWDYFEKFSRAHGGPAGPERGPLLDFAFDRIARHEEALAAPVLDFLATKRNVRVIGAPRADRATRVPTISFVVDGRSSEEIVTAVDPHRIGIRFGDFYARRLIDRLGLEAQNGVVRVSLVHYNTVDEVERLVGVLDRVL